MGELRVVISDVAHGKLKMMCKIFNKKQDELIEELILKAPLPRMAWDIIVADEAGAKVSKVEVKPEDLEKRRKIEFIEGEE